MSIGPACYKGRWVHIYTDVSFPKQYSIGAY